MKKTITQYSIKTMLVCLLAFNGVAKLSATPTPPTITVRVALVSFLNCGSAASDYTYATVDGTNLTAKLVFTAPAGYLISADSETGPYTSVVNVTPVAGSVSTDLYIKQTNTVLGFVSGYITCTSTGAATVSLPVSGLTLSKPKINKTIISTVDCPNKPVNLSTSGNDTSKLTVMAGYTKSDTTLTLAPHIMLMAVYSFPSKGNLKGFRYVAPSTGLDSITLTVYDQTFNLVAKSNKFLPTPGVNNVSVALGNNVEIARYPLYYLGVWGKGNISLQKTINFTTQGAFAFDTLPTKLTSIGGSFDNIQPSVALYLETANTTTGFSWTNANNTNIGTGSSVTVNPAANTSYYATATSSNGCTAIDTAKVSVLKTTTSTTNISVCTSQLPYSWNGLIFTVAGTQTAHISNAAGCDSAAKLVLTVSNPLTPTISISSNNNNINLCSGILVTFTAIITNGGTTPVYQWKMNGVNVGTNSSTYSSTSLVNSDSVWCVLTSSACVTTATVISNKVKMIIKNSPLVSPVKNNVSVNITSLTMCAIGGQSTLYNSYLGGTWSSSNPAVATAVNGVAASGASSSGLLTALSNGTTTVTYTIAGGNGCSSSASATIFVDAVSALNTTTGIGIGVCIGGTLTLSNSSTVPVGGSSAWASTAGRATVDAAGIVTGVNAGTASIKYTITNTSGCTNSTTSSVPVNSLPGIPTINYAAGTVNPQTGAGGAFCNNRTFTVVGSPTGGVWSTTNALVVTVTSAGLAKTVGVGAGSIVYTYTNALGCSNSRSIVGNIVTCATRGVNGNQPINQSTNQQFLMYPNPAKTFIRLNVETLIGAGTIVVTDLYGKQVKVQSLSIGNNTVDIATLAKGVYFVSTITNEGKNTKKLVVE